LRAAYDALRSLGLELRVIHGAADATEGESTSRSRA
jgi:hypothetical protein